MELLELLGIGVQLETGLLRGLEDHLPSLITDIGLVIQDPGNGAHGVTGLGRKVFDGHTATSFRSLSSL